MYTVICQHYTILYCSVLNYTIQFDVLYYAKLCHTIQNDLNKSSLNSCSTKLLNTGLDQAARQKYEYWPHLEYFCRAAFKWTLVQSILLLTTAFCYFSLATLHYITYYTTMYYASPYHATLHHTTPQFNMLHHTMLHYTIPYYAILYHNLLCYSILYYTMMYYTML